MKTITQILQDTSDSLCHQFSGISEIVTSQGQLIITFKNTEGHQDAVTTRVFDGPETLAIDYDERIALLVNELVVRGIVGVQSTKVQ